MIRHRVPLAACLLCATLASSAQAQTANATAPNTNAGGPNQAQQFPSGGATSPDGSGASGGSSKMGAPTAVEKQEQKNSDASTQICKGC